MENEEQKLPEGVAPEAVKTEEEVAATGVDTEKVAEEAVEATPENLAAEGAPAEGEAVA